MNGTSIHLNLKMVEILKDLTQKINTCSESSVETLEEGVIFSKLKSNDSRAMTSFCSGVDRAHKF